MTGFAVPVVLAVYNRPSKVQRLVEILGRVRPSTVLVVADGPKADRADDAERVREVRKILDRIPWPCELLRMESPVNVGCDTWVPRGIDWAFEQVERAIILEDDLIVHPGFFPWCAGMLERYEHDDGVHCICGRNEMVSWGDGGDDHALVRRGSHLGVATWRRAWRVARAAAIPDRIADGKWASTCGDGEALVFGHFRMLHDLAVAGVLCGWDTRWELQRAVLGGLAAVSATNQVVHGGFDNEATHAQPDRSMGLRAIQPLCAPPFHVSGTKRHVDARLDRWSLLVELADRCRDPRRAVLLARTKGLVHDPHVRHHLSPFGVGSELAHAISHLRTSGCSATWLDALHSRVSTAGSSDGCAA